MNAHRVRRAHAQPTLAALTLAATLLTGCASAPLPTYPPMNADASLETMRQRFAAVQSIAGRGELILDDPNHGEVRLETAFVMRPPNHARVRAWKLGHAVFDLTSSPDGVWLYTPDEQPPEPAPIAADPNAPPRAHLTESLARTSEALPDWMAVLWGQVGSISETNTRDSSGSTADTLVFTRQLTGANTLRATVKRATLTTQRAEVVDPAGAVLFSLNLSEYRDLQGTLWPCTITATSPAGTLTITTDSISVNTALDAAFAPPPRARKLPRNLP